MKQLLTSIEFLFIVFSINTLSISLIFKVYNPGIENEFIRKAEKFKIAMKYSFICAFVAGIAIGLSANSLILSNINFSLKLMIIFLIAFIWSGIFTGFLLINYYLKYYINTTEDSSGFWILLRSLW